MSTTLVPRAFGDELRNWRARRGLSQLDLAVRAGTTQRHVSFIEQGRSTPGRAMVARLAESLELTLADRNALLLAAGFAPVFPESDLHGAELRPVREALDTILAGHEPYPAIVVRHGGDIVASNASADLLFEGADAALLEAPVNAYRLALHPGGLARRIHNLAEWGQHVVISLHAAMRRSPTPALGSLVAELDGYVPRTPPGPDHVGFAVPLRLASDDGDLTLITTLMSFATATDVTLAGLRMEAFLPGDDATAQILRVRHARRQHGSAAPDGNR